MNDFLILMVGVIFGFFLAIGCQTPDEIEEEE